MNISVFFLGSGQIFGVKEHDSGWKFFGTPTKLQSELLVQIKLVVCDLVLPLSEVGGTSLAM